MENNATVLMHWSEGLEKENKTFKTIREFEHFVYRFICPNAPEPTQGYDKTKFTITFPNGFTYTGRWDVQKHHAWSYHLLDDQIKPSLQWHVNNPKHMGQEYADQCKEALDYLATYEANNA